MSDTADTPKPAKEILRSETMDQRFERLERENAERVRRKHEAEVARKEQRRTQLDQQRRDMEDDGDIVEGGEQLIDITPKAPSKQVAVYVPPEEVTRLDDEGNQLPWEKIETFLFYYARSGLWNQSAYRAGLTPTHMKRWENDSPALQELVRQARDDFKESLEGELVRRARDGVVKPVFGKEGVVGYVREYSDRLLELSLKAADPGKYAEKGGPGLPDGAKFGVLVVPGIVASPEEWEKLHGQQARGTLPQLVDPPSGGNAAGAGGAKAGGVSLPVITRPVRVGR